MMDGVGLWIMDIIGPALLLIVLIWLVIKVRKNSDDPQARRVEDATRDLYTNEEQRRRDGTDAL